MEIPTTLISMKIDMSIFVILIFQALANGIKKFNQKWLKMGETPKYNPLPDIRVHGNFHNTSKSENGHVNFWNLDFSGFGARKSQKTQKYELEHLNNVNLVLN